MVSKMRWEFSLPSMKERFIKNLSLSWAPVSLPTTTLHTGLDNNIQIKSWIVWEKSHFTLFVHQSRAEFIAILTDNKWIHWYWLFKLFNVGSCGKFSISQSVKLATYSSIPGHQSKPRLIDLSICCIFPVLLSGRPHSHGAYGCKNC